MKINVGTSQSGGEAKKKISCLSKLFQFSKKNGMQYCIPFHDHLFQGTSPDNIKFYSASAPVNTASLALIGAPSLNLIALALPKNLGNSDPI